MRRILVTGGSGFLGQRLIWALAQHGDFPVVLQRDSVADRENKYARAIVFGSFEQVARAIAEYECDTVVHLAAQTQVSVAAVDPIGSFESNTRGTWQVLEACRQQKVRRVIVASSDKAYSDAEVPYREETPLRPHGIYATSKACADLIAQSYLNEYQMSIAITRCGNLYGPGHTNWTTLIPGTIRSYLEGRRPRLRSTGGPKRDWLYVDDAVDGYLKLIDSEHTGAFNFGTSRGTNVLDVVALIRQLIGSDLLPQCDVDEAGLGRGGLEIQSQIVDANRATKFLSWKPMHSLEQGLIKAIDWYRQYLLVFEK